MDLIIASLQLSQKGAGYEFPHSNAVRLRNTMVRELGRRIVDVAAKPVIVRETVSIVRPR